MDVQVRLASRINQTESYKNGTGNYTRYVELLCGVRIDFSRLR